jgi:hypothetical protein
MIVARRPVGKGAEAAQQAELLLAKTRNVGEALFCRHGDGQAKPSNGLEKPSSQNSRNDRVQGFHRPPSQIESVGGEKFGSSFPCRLLDPIAPALPLIGG